MSARKAKESSEIDGLTFEQALTRLDETVAALEAGELPLDQATSLYETGMKLARKCNELLASAELKITQIQTAFGEQMRMVTEEDGEEMEGSL